MSSDLPRLLYLGDVPVEASYHGSALLYRLLQGYPADRLRVIEGNLFTSRSDRRLPGVRYESLQVCRPRLLNSRLHDWYSLWLMSRSAGRTRQLPPLLDGFEPEAIMTVGHGYTWVTAARFAAERGVALHMVCHDDWPSVVPSTLRNRVDREFGDAYRQAASRLCVSPQMVSEYERRYGAGGTVLYPARGLDPPVFTAPPERLRRNGGAPTLAFAGTINSAGYARLLRRVADALEPLDGQLLLFGPGDQEHIRSLGLDHPRIRRRGLVPAAELMTRLRDEADVLLVPMSFAPEDRSNMEMSFPSKLTDYTAVGLPLLIYGPSYSSAVHWSNANTGVAETVTSEEPEALAGAIARLAHNPDHRWRLAETAQEVGERFFSAAKAQAVFHGALARSAMTAAPATP